MKPVEYVRKQPIHVWVYTVIIAMSIFFHLFGFGGHIGSSYRDGQWGNQWVPFWAAFFGLILDLQACYMLHQLWQGRIVQRKILWSIYIGWMFILALMLIIADGISSQRGEITGHNGVSAVWGGTWLLILFIMINLLWFESLQKFCRRKIVANDDPPRETESSEKLPPIALASKTEPVQSATDRPMETNQQNCCRRCCSFRCTVKGIAWSSIGFLSIFGFLLVLQAIWNAHDTLNYGPLGQRIPVRMMKEMNLSTVAPVLHSSTINLHLLCQGPANSGSTFILEAGGGAFSASFFALQDRLAAGGRRSCAYDRAGYGWSDVLPVPTNSYQAVYYLNRLLANAGETGPFILVGHSVGGQLIQLYAALFPNQIRGLILLDSVPDFIYPLSLTGKSLDSTVTFNDLKPFLRSTQSLIDLYRVGAAFSIHRWLQRASADYQPSHLAGYVNAGYGKTLNWHAQYFDYIGTPHMIEILDGLSSQKYLNGFGWPTLQNPTTPVLGVITNTTAGGPGSLCSSSTDTSCSVNSRLGRAYYDGMQRQVTTISTNHTFLVCDAPCSHGFISTNKVDWLAATILSKFSGV